MAVLTQKELSEKTGVSRPYISRMCKEGRLKLTENKKIDEFEPCNQSFILETTRRNKNKVKQKATPPNKKTPSMQNKKAKKEEKEERQEESEYDSYQKERAKKLVSENELLKIKLATIKKELISTEIMSRCVHSVFGSLFNLLVTQYPHNITDEIIDTIQAKGSGARTEIIRKQTEELTKLIKTALDQSEKTLKIEYKKMVVVK